jgi:uncharacterized protein YciI
VSYFAVIRQRGPAWNASRSLDEQVGWPAHAAFMNALAADGFVVLGGPLGPGFDALLVIEAEDADEIRRRLAADPWTELRLLTIASVEPWHVLLAAPGASVSTRSKVR